MLVDIVDVKHLGVHRLWIRFEDGVEGELDFADRLIFEGIFSSLREPERFAEVAVHPELGVLCWPCGADLDSDVLHSELTGRPIQLQVSADVA